MATVSDCLRLSARVYAKTARNEILLSRDWEQLELLRDHPLTGFAAGVFRHRGTGEVVIAFTGTNEEQVRDWVSSNLPAFFGAPSPQVLAARRPAAAAGPRKRHNRRAAAPAQGGGRAWVARA